MAHLSPGDLPELAGSLHTQIQTIEKEPFFNTHENEERVSRTHPEDPPQHSMRLEAGRNDLPCRDEIRFSKAKWPSWSSVLIPVLDFSSANRTSCILFPPVRVESELREDRETPRRNGPLQVEGTQSYTLSTVRYLLGAGMESALVE